jgi:hypothetical protein
MMTAGSHREGDRDREQRGAEKHRESLNAAEPHVGPPRI